MSLRARAQGEPLPVLAVDADVRFRSPEDRAAFADELAHAVVRLVARYHDETAANGRRHRVLVGVHPIPRRHSGRHTDQGGSMTDFDPEDPTARVSAHAVEVPGTPEQVWQAIATGPGIATWFVPAEVDEREGGRITTDHGTFGTSEGVVTRWEPPLRFAYEERNWNPDDPDAPPWATEMLVSAKDGGSCVVRLVSGFFTGGDGWEKHLEGTDEGWVAALRHLRLALTHFPGSTAVSMQAAGMVAGRSPDDVGSDLLEVLGVADLSGGVSCPDGR